MAGKQLSVRQEKQVREALLSAFDRGGLRIMLHEEMGVDLARVSGDGNLEEVVFELVGWAERNGRTRDLIDAAYRSNSGNPALQQLRIDSQSWGTFSIGNTSAFQEKQEVVIDAKQAPKNPLRILEVLLGIGLLVIATAAVAAVFGPRLLRLTPSFPPQPTSMSRPTEAAPAETSRATQPSQSDTGTATEPSPPAAAAMAKPVTFVDCSSVDSIPDAQCRSLADFYQYAVVPERSAGNQSFPVNDPCAWQGEVACKDGNVIELTLPKRGLSGTIPPSIGGLQHLKILRLNGNELTGPIPKQIGQLVNLEQLWLQSNKLSGPIPPELGQLVNLERLWLAANELSGAIPAQIGRLSKLQELQIFSNTLTGTIPQDLGNLANLRALNLNDNQLTGTIPPELGRLQMLNSDFGLANNHLVGPIPNELGMLANMQVLELRCNDLEGEIPVALCQLKALHRLFLQGNKLRGVVPNCLAYLPLLDEIELGGNSLTATEPQLEDSLREQGSECVNH